MALVQLHRKGQMTLPQNVRAQFGLDEGDLLDVEVHEDTIVLRPKKLIDASQAYFWTEDWQAAERQASADIAAGRTISFPDAEAAIAYLHEQVARQQDR
jgi:AbrB family looped-hinge helix DNA binding protein